MEKFVEGLGEGLVVGVAPVRQGCLKFLLVGCNARLQLLGELPALRGIYDAPQDAGETIEHRQENNDEGEDGESEHKNLTLHGNDHKSKRFIEQERRNKQENAQNANEDDDEYNDEPDDDDQSELSDISRE